MRLVIAEKPSVARDIAAVLGKVTRNDGYMTAGEYTVTYAVGHLVGLADADAYDTRYKSWRMADLPILPEPFRLVVLEHAKSQYRVVSKLLKQAQEVIVATDAGREGTDLRTYCETCRIQGTCKAIVVIFNDRISDSRSFFTFARQ